MALSPGHRRYDLPRGAGAAIGTIVAVIGATIILAAAHNDISKNASVENAFFYERYLRQQSVKFDCILLNSDTTDYKNPVTKSPLLDIL